MQRTGDDHYYRVICSSGDVFHTRARTAVEFILDPAFVQFMILSVLLFTALMLALDLPAIAQVILFGAGIVSTFFCLGITITIYLAVARALKITTLFTPIMLVPMQVFNGLIMHYVLTIFEPGYSDGFEFWQITIRTAVIIVCMDIIHGKFVAPTHGLTITHDPDGKSVERRAEQTPHPSPAIAPPSAQATGDALAAETGGSETLLDGGSAQSVALAPVAGDVVVIGRKSYDLSKVYAIRSEDHYLVLQFEDGSEMVRGRLRDVVSKIDVSMGIQINRSAWIPYAVLQEVRETPKGQVEVTLNNGLKLRVSKSRTLLFEHGCGQYAPAVEWQRDMEENA